MQCIRHRVGPMRKVGTASHVLNKQAFKGGKEVVSLQAPAPE